MIDVEERIQLTLGIASNEQVILNFIRKKYRGSLGEQAS